MLCNGHETSEEAVERRKRIYGCSGHCYNSEHMCGAIDICEETRREEGCAMAVALLIIAFVIGASVVVIGVWFIRYVLEIVNFIF